MQQPFPIRRHQPDDPAQYVGRTHRQMKLAHADVDPHVAGRGVKERVARVAQPGNVIIRAMVLVGDADVDMSDTDDVAEVLGGAVVLFF